jgi:arylsulfatase A-like enzyme
MNVLWVVVDCLRYDALSSNGYERATTNPLDDRLEGDFVEFSDAATQSGFTLNVLTSLITGTYPSTHGVLRWSDQYDGDPPAYTEYAADTDLAPPEAIPAMNFVSEEWGLDSAFDTVHDLESAKATRNCHQAIAEEVFETAREVVAGRDQFNVLCWLFDLHTPRLSTPTIGDGSPRDHYDSELRYVAEELESFLAHLEETGQYKDTLVVLTGDHGDIFDEFHRLPWHPATETVAQIPGLGRPLRGDYLGHLGRPLVEELVHVPLYVKFPAGHGGETVTGQVELIDILPTVLDTAGAPVPSTVEGRSLVPQVEGKASGKEFVRAKMGPNPVDGIQQMCRSDDEKYLRYDPPTFDQVGSPKDGVHYVARRFFTPQEVLLARKNEHENRIQANPAAADRFRRELEQMSSTGGETERELTDQKRRELEELGYL